ncbi:hypothetical protein P8452_57217 [Trifolium repens]|nr:hypothetical protein P8452_57216 [Trifolium repens]WJX73435.1 hypothetical protein P8452_57217 [Trifolium repens]
MYLSLWYMVRFPRKAKTPLERGVEKIVMYSVGVAYYIRRKGPGLLQISPSGSSINVTNENEKETKMDLWKAMVEEDAIIMKIDMRRGITTMGRKSLVRFNKF